MLEDCGFDVAPGTSLEGEGCRSTAEAAETTTWTQDVMQKADLCGTPPPVSNRSSRHPGRASTISTRRFRRACTRAHTHGITWYQGKPFSIADVLRSWAPSPSKPQSWKALAHSNQSHRARDKHRLVYWNRGGLSSSLFSNKLSLWLRRRSTDIAIICETRWSFTS